MRKVEQRMNAALERGRDYAEGNTLVAGGRVYLHGNEIARTIGGRLHVNPATFAAWPTRTTASRLRALGFDACIRNGRAVLDGIEL